MNYFTLMGLNNKIRVIIVDDHASTRKGLALYIEEDEELELIAEARNGKEGYEKIIYHKPDVAVIDIEIPDINGLDLSKCIKNELSTKIIIYTGYNNLEYFYEAVSIDVDGYVYKDEDLDEVIKAIKTVYSGDPYFSPKAQKLLKRRNKEKDDINKLYPGLASLTLREKEVLKLISENLTTKEISEKLFIAKRTVDTHRLNIIHKLNLKGKHSALLLFALRYKNLL